MRLIVCLDDNNGMLFNHRRQSSDRAVRQRMAALSGGAPLWMNSYTAKQFSEESANIMVDEAFLAKTPDQAYCFAETEQIREFADKVSQLIIYRWNRIYPSDVKLPELLRNKNWKLVRRSEFPGYSHEKITEEIYSL